MIQPDQQKRAALLQAARAEEEAYERFKQSNKIQQVHYVAKLGGKCCHGD